MRKGFTLLELIIVIIIIGILGALGFAEYSKTVEKGRAAEAKTILSNIRRAQIGYKLEYGTYTATLSNLPIVVPQTCTATHYFFYWCSASLIRAFAARCSSGGKTPNANYYEIALQYDAGVWDYY